MSLPAALVARNVDHPDARERDVIERELTRLSPLDVPARVAAWAEHFRAWGEADYVLGDAPEGYVTGGRLVDDHHTDCVLFTHRAVELAHATSAEGALAEALARRFPDGDPQEIVAADGRVDYSHPSRIAFAWELLEAGVLGANATGEAGPAVEDVATARFAAGRVRYLPKQALDPSALRDGDVVWFILDESHAGAARVREAIGAAVGHLGVLSREGAPSGDLALVHAASADLPGVYRGGRVVSVPLATYLARVERFKGIAITRFAAARARDAI